MRPISAEAKRAMAGEETGEVFLVALIIEHPNWTQPVYVVHNTEEIHFLGDEELSIPEATFLPFPFVINLPDERDDELPEVTVRIDNVERTLIENLRSTPDKPTFRLLVFHVISEGTPDESVGLEAGPFDFSLRDCTYNALEVVGTLTYEAILEEPFPGWTFSPDRFPGLFK